MIEILDVYSGSVQGRHTDLPLRKTTDHVIRKIIDRVINFGFFGIREWYKDRHNPVSVL